MQVGLLEMPEEKVWRVQLDGQRIKGYIEADVTRPGRWQVFDEGASQPMKQRPHSREGAAALLLYLHYERERKAIEAKRKES